MPKPKPISPAHADTVPAAFPFRRIRRGVIASILPLLAGGCMTNAQFLAQNSSAALETAESRARFELDCPRVSASILSQKVMNIWGVRAGYEWTEYTVGVRGCGREAVYLTTCQDPSTCNAYAQTGRILPRFTGGPPAP